MKSFTYLSALMGVSSAYVFPRAVENKAAGFTAADCPDPGAEFWRLSEQVAGQEKRELLERDANNETLTARADVTINTYFHVISASQKAEDGNVSDEQIKKQMDIINEAFNKRNFAFKLMQTTRTVDADLAVITTGEKTEKLGSKLRKGDYTSLNLYIVKDMPGNTAGDCTFPVSRTGGKFAGDGCRFNSDTLPSKSDGRVLIHEIGHWLGLAHTFQEGVANPNCTTGNGDQVADTPVHLRPTGASCNPTDSCPGIAGTDPVNNFMNYTPSKCWTGFTDGQATRMHSMWNVRNRAK